MLCFAQNGIGQPVFNPSQPGPGAAQDLNAQLSQTHWSIVLMAGDVSAPAAGEALNKLCRTYWRPLYAFARRRGHDSHEAEDLTQAFFEELLQRDWLKGVEKQKGRFRTFLLTSMEHFLNNDWNKQHRLKRGGRFDFVSLNAENPETLYNTDLAATTSAEKLFDRTWALNLVAHVFGRLKKDYSAMGKARVFEALSPHLSLEIEPGTYAEAAANLQTNTNAVKVAMHRLRRSFGELLRAEIAHTLSRPADLEDEVRHLFAAWGSE